MWSLTRTSPVGRQTHSLWGDTPTVLCHWRCPWQWKGADQIGEERSVASIDIVQLIVGSMQASRHIHRQVKG